MAYCSIMTKDLMRLNANYNELLKQQQVHKFTQQNEAPSTPIPPSSLPPPPPLPQYNIAGASNNGLMYPYIQRANEMMPRPMPIMQYQNEYYGYQQNISPYPYMIPAPQPIPLQYPTCIQLKNGDVIGYFANTTVEEWECLLSSNKGQLASFANLIIGALREMVYSQKKHKEDTLERIL